MRAGEDRDTGEWRLAERMATRVLAVYGEAFGSTESLLRERGFSGTDLPPGLAVADLASLTSRAISELAARDAMLSGRRPLGRSDWRVILYSLSGSRTLREALIRCSECFEAIDWRCGRMTLRTRGDVAELELSPIRPGGSTIEGCLVDLFGLAQIHGLLGWLIDHPIPVRHAWLDHDPAVFAALKLPDLPFALRLDAGWTGFDFNAALLDYPVVRNAGELDGRPLRNILITAEGHEVGVNAVDRVRRITLAALRDTSRLPGFDEVAGALNVSQATLRRRLVREGMGYRQIRESCRRELALDLLVRTRLPIEDIAMRLDYCDSDAFRQAFRRWAGQTPSSYRGAKMERSAAPA